MASAILVNVRPPRSYRSAGQRLAVDVFAQQAVIAIVCSDAEMLLGVSALGKLLEQSAV